MLFTHCCFLGGTVGLQNTQHPTKVQTKDLTKIQTHVLILKRGEQTQAKER